MLKVSKLEVYAMHAYQVYHKNQFDRLLKLYMFGQLKFPDKCRLFNGTPRIWEKWTSLKKKDISILNS